MKPSPPSPATFAAPAVAVHAASSMLQHTRRLGRGEELEDESLAASDVHKEGCKHQALHRHELHQDVQGGAGGVLEGIAHSVTDDCGLVAVGALAAQLAGVLGCTSLR